MADLRIAVPELLESEVQPTDPLLISDLSASESKKVTPVALFAASVGRLPLPIPSSKPIRYRQTWGCKRYRMSRLLMPWADTLTARVIAPDAIGSGLATGAVDNAAIQAAAVTGSAVDGSIAADTINDYNIASAGISVQHCRRINCE